MTTLKFDKAVKYQGVRYAAHEAFKVDDEDVSELKKAGATILSTDAVTPPEPSVGDNGEDREDEVKDEQKAPAEDATQLKEKLLEYTVPELIKFAEDRNIDLQKKTKKAEIYNIIVASLN
jgi:hypothetical protein